jgi:hypothetical protein
MHSSKNIAKLNLVPKVILFTVLSAAFVACSPKKREKPQIHPNQKAPITVQDSFSVGGQSQKGNVTTGTGAAKDSTAAIYDYPISINKSVLGKAFLVSSSIIDYYIAPRISHLKPKIVTFKKVGKQLAMFELDTMSVYDDIASDKLVQTFEISSENNNSIEFNLKLGFSSIALKEDLGIAEMTIFPTREEAVINPTSSYVESAKFENNELLIVQNSKVKSDYANVNLFNVLFGMPTAIQTAEVNMKIQTRITPYKENPNFMPKQIFASDMKKVGYFVTDKMKKNDGEVQHLANTWDISEASGPITYVISSNTPEKFVEAVKEGILYWNRQIGREVFKVETGGDPKEIGSYRRSIVHWAPWAKAGFAVASLQADPLTGELMSTNVYMTSVFPEGAKLETILEAKKRSAESTKTQENLKLVRGIAPTGFALDISCTMKMNEMLSGLTSQVEVLKDNPQLVERAQTDIIRWIVAHEVGHTIGLRHNFAGSLGSEYESFQKLEEDFDKYIKEPNHQGGATSSSVMDYINTKDILLGGAYIKRSNLKYDAKAIKFGYTQNESYLNTLAENNDVLFCSDLEAMGGTATDCTVFDSGKDPIMNSIYSAGGATKRLMTYIYELVLEIKFGGLFGDSRLSFQDILSNMISPENLASDAAYEYSAIQKALTLNGRFLAINRQLGGSSWGKSKSKYSTALTERQTKQFEDLGGIIGLITKLVPVDDKNKIQRGWLINQAQKIISSPNFNSGKTLSGIEYTLNASDKTFIESTLLEFADRYEEAYLNATLTALAPNFVTETSSSSNSFSLFGGSTSSNGPAPYNYNLPVESWSEDISAFVENTVMGREEEPVVVTEGTFQYSMPKPIHHLDSRLAALKLLSEKLYGKSSMLKDAKTKLLDTQKNKVGYALGLITTATITTPAPISSGTPVALGTAPTGSGTPTAIVVSPSTPIAPVATTTDPQTKVVTSGSASSNDVYTKIKSISSLPVKAWALKEMAVLKSLEELVSADSSSTNPSSISDITKKIPPGYED